ncbi:MAG: hypothetical protein DRP86_07285 [Candidatus Neomarinimicrobiota bacterium]|nr:MAG: hypothetical protein DRP86_07285 [Candidatus Neomarinimicrobiota bacterium]
MYEKPVKKKSWWSTGFFSYPSEEGFPDTLRYRGKLPAPPFLNNIHIVKKALIIYQGFGFLAPEEGLEPPT